MPVRHVLRWSRLPASSFYYKPSGTLKGIKPSTHSVNQDGELLENTEVVKDIEDMEGDAKYNCKTMPIVWGVPSSKVFAGVWLIVLIGALIILQLYAFQLGWWITGFYCFLMVLLPLVWILRKLYTAQNTGQYHQLSRLIKLVMLSGILSILFFKWYL